MPPKTHPRQCLPREALKSIAMVLMVLDHAYMTVVAAPGFQWMTMAGRLAFPIFAFQIAEGYTKTSDKKRYLLHMFVFALISEIPYNLMMGGEIVGPFHQNVMFTFLIALLLLLLMDKVLNSRLPVLAKAGLVAGVCLLAVVVGTICFVDYSGFGVLTVLIFYLARRIPNEYLTMAVEFAGLFVINWVMLGGQVFLLPGGFELPEQGLALLALPLIWCYNGKKALHGRWDKMFQYGGYLFYPLHILVLSLIALY